MGRTFGPYAELSTTRVDGAYEVYQGTDDEEREIEVLALGVSSSKDPGRRALLSDTVAWAHATRGPSDAAILSADLDAEQPYVVIRRQAGFRGVDRMLERMLAMGPPTGPLQSAAGPHTGQIPAVAGPGHTDPHGIPRVASAPPAGSPATSGGGVGLAPRRRRRPALPWIAAGAVALALILLAVAAVVLWDEVGDSEDSGSQPEIERDDEEADTTPEPEAESTPQWRADAVGPIPEYPQPDAEFGPERAEPGWPFAFRLPQDFSCGFDQNHVLCEFPGEDARIQVELRDCADQCGSDERAAALDRAGLAAESMAAENVFLDDGLADVGVLTAVTFFQPRANAAAWTPTTTAVITVDRPRSDPELDQRLRQAVNDILSQTSTVD